MVFNRGLGRAVDFQHALQTLRVLSWSRKGTGGIGGEVALANPGRGFVGMFPARPAPEHCVHVEVCFPNDAFGDGVPMMIGPPS